MKFYCPNGHFEVELEGEAAAMNADAVRAGNGPRCGTCDAPLTTLAPFQKTCHPEFGCSCLDVARIKVEKGEALFVAAPHWMNREQLHEVARGFRELLVEAGHAGVPVLVGPEVELTVIAAETEPREPLPTGPDPLLFAEDDPRRIAYEAQLDREADS